MSDADGQLIFSSDPKRFMELVATDDMSARLDGFNLADDVVLCEIARYGIFNDEEMLPSLRELYEELAMKMPEERRHQIYRHIMGLVENVSAVSANAFLPFIAVDDSPRIVATAVIDYVCLGQLTNEDPLSRPRDILGMLESGFLKNEGAAFGGLLHVGDRRVCKLLQPLRESLDKDSFKVAIHCSTGFIHSAVVDFYLNWLEGLVGDDDDGLFGAVAQGLLSHKKSCGGDEIFTGDRPFPASSVSPKQSREMRKPIPLSEYSTKVAPRFYALERSEPPPRIMPYVLREWGFEPVTDSTDAAALDDRFRTA